MKFPVYGAGVLGCNLARNLFRAGKDVTPLARGDWATELQTSGLRIKDKFSPRLSVSRIPVVTALRPGEAYDVVFVVMRYTQLGAILDTLRASRAKHIVFVGNNVRASAFAAALTEKNVLFAFTSAAGHRERVASIDLKKLRGSTAYLSRMLDANIGGYRAIRNAGHAILPKEDADFEGAACRRICRSVYHISAGSVKPDPAVFFMFCVLTSFRFRSILRLRFRNFSRRHFL